MLLKSEFIDSLKDLVLSEKKSKKSIETKIGMFLNKFDCMIAEDNNTLKEYEYQKTAVEYFRVGFATIYDSNSNKKHYISKDSVLSVSPENRTDTNQYNRSCDIFLKNGECLRISGNRAVVPFLIFIS